MSTPSDQFATARSMRAHLPPEAFQFSGGAAVLSATPAPESSTSSLLRAREQMRAQIAAWPTKAAGLPVQATARPAAVPSGFQEGARFFGLPPGRAPVSITEREIRETAALLKCSAIQAFERLYADRAVNVAQGGTGPGR